MSSTRWLGQGKALWLLFLIFLALPSSSSHPRPRFLSARLVVATGVGGDGSNSTTSHPSSASTLSSQSPLSSPSSPSPLSSSSSPSSSSVDVSIPINDEHFLKNQMMLCANLDDELSSADSATRGRLISGWTQLLLKAAPQMKPMAIGFAMTAISTYGSDDQIEHARTTLKNTHDADLETLRSILDSCVVVARAARPLVVDAPFFKRFPLDVMRRGMGIGADDIFEQTAVVDVSVIAHVVKKCGLTVVYSQHKLPVLLQPNSRACGPTAAMMVLMQFGFGAREDVCTEVETNEGTTATGVAKIIARYGEDLHVVAKVESFAVKDVREATLQMQSNISPSQAVIALLSGGSGHYVVIDSATVHGVRIRDPWHGWEVTIAVEAFWNRFGLVGQIILVTQAK